MKTIYPPKMFALDREGLVLSNKVTHPVNREDVQDLVRFIDEHLHPAKCINRRHSAYGLKQSISRYLGRYVWQGEMIAAMQLSGFTARRIDDSGNAWFNVDSNSVNRMHRKFKYR